MFLKYSKNICSHIIPYDCDIMQYLITKSITSLEWQSAVISRKKKKLLHRLQTLFEMYVIYFCNEWLYVRVYFWTGLIKHPINLSLNAVFFMPHCLWGIKMSGFAKLFCQATLCLIVMCDKNDWLQADGREMLQRTTQWSKVYPAGKACVGHSDKTRKTETWSEPDCWKLAKNANYMTIDPENHC